MTQNAHVPAREPVADILREAARLGQKSCGPGRCRPPPVSCLRPSANPSIPFSVSRNRSATVTPWITPSPCAPSTAASAWCRRLSSARNASPAAVSRCTVYHLHTRPAPSRGSPASVAAASRHRHQRTLPTRRKTSTSAASAATGRLPRPGLPPRSRPRRINQIVYPR